MQPVKLTIPGKYWDSQIYAGRLYLFGRDGEISTLDWEHLITEWKIERNLRLVMDCAFTRSDYLYGDRWTLLFSDEEIKKIIIDKFKRLLIYIFEVSDNQLSSATIRKQNNPFPFPHTDSTIYKKSLYVTSKDGVFRSSCQKSSGYPVSTRPEKKCDTPVVGIAASYNSLALAAGNEGLFELHLGNDWYSDEERLENLAKTNCIACNWVFYSIYGSSHVEQCYLANYVKEINKDEQNYFKRTFDRYISDQEIFQSKGYSWGNQNKLCQAIDGHIKVIKYSPWLTEENKKLEIIGTITLPKIKGDIISASVALFGTIIEYDSALIVVPSEGQPMVLDGEPINWRIFPRSKFYGNQLHVIYEDRLNIFSFNHDYFVNQREKMSGFAHY